jgi:peptidoglycan/xylan/chitin deacetylase (PgdA/CDA1 family)
MVGDASFRPRPRAFYYAKALATHWRTLQWQLSHDRTVREDGLRILFYHRISTARDQLAVLPRRFRTQMEYLARHGYTTLDVDAAAHAYERGVLPPRALGLCFDDGYLDVAENALPILREHGFRATVFVTTGVVDGQARFTWYKRQPPVIPWDAIVRLDAEGTLRFGAHTVTHPNLAALDEAEARLEIEGSKLQLEARLGRPVGSFCYPGGLFGAREAWLAREAGYRFAVSCEPGLNVTGTDPFALHRVQVERDDVLLDFRAKVAGGHDAPLPLRAAYRRWKAESGLRPVSSRS